MTACDWRAVSLGGRDCQIRRCYHGHSDAMLVRPGAACEAGQASSAASQPASWPTVCRALQRPGPCRSVSVSRASGSPQSSFEPVAGNMGLVIPAEAFWRACARSRGGFGALLIFDEVITGFRFGPTTLRALVRRGSGLVCLGKSSEAAFADWRRRRPRRDPRATGPAGPVYQAGTLSGNPVALAAGRDLGGLGT